MASNLCRKFRTLVMNPYIQGADVALATVLIDLNLDLGRPRKRDALARLQQLVLRSRNDDSDLRDALSDLGIGE